ncbi:MAG TPA: hypothetical protein VFD01_10765 [Candidatus Dormibacteraeota bacterium]|jgi:hypothetical protein|nr:hypothetical protein [Candidatus Dormibacteraeota bacterium]
MSSVLVSPTPSTEAGRFSLAPRRVRDLNGRTVGLLDSGKFNSDRLLDAVADLLRERYAVGEVVRRRKPSFSRPVPEAMAQELAERCDVVIAGVGD